MKQLIKQLIKYYSNIKQLLKYQTDTQISNRYSNIKQLLKYQTVTGAGKEEISKNSFQGMSTSSHLLQKLKVVLMWSCLLG